MRCAINTAVQRGLPTVAECGGFLYLGQTLEDDAGTAHPMAGVLPGQGFRVGRLVRFGYAALGSRCPCMSSTIGIPPATAPLLPPKKPMATIGTAALPTGICMRGSRIYTGRAPRCRSAL